MFVKSIAIILLIIVFVASATTSAIASGVGVSPGQLDFSNNLQDIKQILYVMNTGNERSEYNVYVEGEYENWFEISPDSFSLDPNENIAVEISLSAPSATGEHKVDICIVSFPETVDLKIGTGVKVRASISSVQIIPESIPIATSKQDHFSSGMRLWIALPAILVALLAAVLFWVVHRRKKRWNAVI